MADKIFKSFKESFSKPSKFNNRDIVTAQFGGELLSLSDLVGADSNSFDENTLKESLLNTNRVDLNTNFTTFTSHAFFSDASELLQVAIHKMFTEYPSTASVYETEKFYNSLTGYEKFVFNNWPKVQREVIYSPNGFGEVLNTTGDSGATLNAAKSSSLSVEFWVNPYGVTSTGSALIVAKQGAISSTDTNLRGWGVFLSCSDDATTGEDSLLTPSTFDLIFNLQDGSKIQNGPSGSLGSVNQGERSHVAITWDGQDTFKSYIDGEYSSTFISSSELAANYESTVNFEVAKGGFSVASNNRDPGGPVFTADTKLSVSPNFSGAIDELRVWSTERTPIEIRQYYNQQILSETGSLLGYWKFNNLIKGPGLTSDTAFLTKSFAIDCTGNENHLQNFHYTHSDGPSFYDVTKQPTLEGTDILNYYDLNIMSGSGEVSNSTTFISQQYTSASLHDNDNRSRLTHFIPDFLLEQDTDPSQGGIGFLKTYLHLVAKELDTYKVFIDQFPNILSSKYQKYDKTPNVFLPFIAENFGFPFSTILDNSTPGAWLRDLRLKDSESSIRTDLQSINNVFWQRILTNLGYIYKKKGTRESLESILRIYGIPLDIFRIVEIGGTITKPDKNKVSNIRTVREYAIRPTGSDNEGGKIRALPNSTATRTALNIGAGTGGTAPNAATGEGKSETTIEARFRLSESFSNTYQTIWEMRGSSSLRPNGTDIDSDITKTSASYMTLYLDTSNISNYPPSASLHLIATRSLASNTETQALNETPVSLSLQLTPFSKSIAYHTSVIIESGSSAPNLRYVLRAKRADDDDIDNATIAFESSSISSSAAGGDLRGYRATIQYATPQSWSFGSGSFFNRQPSPGESAKWSYLGSENITVLEGSINSFRIWNRKLTDNELTHHALNYRSYATDDGISSYDNLQVGYGFEENTSADTNGNTTIFDTSTNEANATASGFTAATNPYRAYNTEILSVFPYYDDGDYGIDNIRTFKSKQNIGFIDKNKFAVAFEANLTDELRRDQADLVFNFDTLSEILGKNPGKVVTEDTYEALEALRKNYFNKRWTKDKSLLLNEYNQAMKYLALNIDHVFRTLMPLRAHYLGSFYAIEPHILERKRNPQKHPNEFITPPARVTNILSSSFSDLSALNTVGLPNELLATSNVYKTIGTLPLQDAELRDSVAAHDRFRNTVESAMRYDFDVDLGAVRRTKVRQSTDNTPRIVTRYLHPINPLNTDIENGKTINQTDLDFNTEQNLNTNNGAWGDDPGTPPEL